MRRGFSESVAPIVSSQQTAREWWSLSWEGGRGGREGGREEGGREGGREGRKEGGRGERREGAGEGGREAGKGVWLSNSRCQVSIKVAVKHQMFR